MDENLVRLDARLGALELLVRNLYAHRFVGQEDPLGSAEQAVRDIEHMAKGIQVVGPEPVVNDMLASEAEEFLIAMFREIVEIVRESSHPRPDPDSEGMRPPPASDPESECPPFLKPSPKLPRTG